MTKVMLISLIAAAVVADQLTKAAALSLLSQGTAVPVLPGFNLTLGFNDGASFGMMGGVMAGKPLLMAALTGALTHRLRRHGIPGATRVGTGRFCVGRGRGAWQHHRPAAAGCRDRFP